MSAAEGGGNGAVMTCDEYTANLYRLDWAEEIVDGSPPRIKRTLRWHDNVIAVATEMGGGFRVRPSTQKVKPPRVLVRASLAEAITAVAEEMERLEKELLSAALAAQIRAEACRRAVAAMKREKGGRT